MRSTGIETSLPVLAHRRRGYEVLPRLGRDGATDCGGHDFSRWTAGVFHDQSLAAALAAAEARLTADRPAALVEQVRVALIAALQERLPS